MIELLLTKKHSIHHLVGVEVVVELYTFEEGDYIVQYIIILSMSVYEKFALMGFTYDG